MANPMDNSYSGFQKERVSATIYTNPNQEHHSKVIYTANRIQTATQTPKDPGMHDVAQTNFQSRPMDKQVSLGAPSEARMHNVAAINPPHHPQGGLEREIKPMNYKNNLR